MTTYRLLCCNSLTSARLGYLDLQDVTFNDPLDGIGALSGKAYVGPAQSADLLSTLAQEDVVSIYVQAEGRYLWGGPIVAAPWNPGERCHEITAMAWKGWLYQRYAGPNPAVNPVADVTYAHTATEQLDIARSVIATAVADDGCPTIRVGAEVSGVTRDLNWLGSDFRFCGDLIDSMANRARGFDWTISVIADGATGLPALYFAPFYPTRGTQAPALTFKKTPNGGNYSVSGSIESSSTDRRTRVWTTGKGTPPDRKMAFDDDPGLITGDALLRETATGYTSADTVDTLATNARAERNFRSAPIRTMQITVFFADLDPLRYDTGDRSQLVYRDEGVSIDLPAVRIVDRAMHVHGDGADYASLTLDLSDSAMPDDTTEA